MILSVRLIPLLPLFLLFWSLQATATSVLPISLERMAAVADVIFHGKVISNEVRRDPVSGNVATYTSFEVTELVKGKAGATHTIKQIGGELPDTRVRQLVHGVPRFSTGQEYVVFLPKASSLGFSSPIGLAQGTFDVHRIDGNPVINSRRAMATTTNKQSSGRVLPSGIEAVPSAEQGVQLGDFLQSVRTMAGE